MDIICKRIAETGRTVVNIPHEVVRHSPTGFEWGYGGSGPSELALNILHHFTDVAHRDKLYQEFKYDFIACLPQEAGGTISSAAIQTWLNNHNAPIMLSQTILYDEDSTDLDG